MRFLVLVLWAAVAYAAPPVLFFTDLDSGPKIGGENNNGAYVTVYGNNFGASPSVTVGGGAVASIKIAPTTYFTFQRMIVQLGSSAVTGNIVVTSEGQNSNGLPFTVRSGNIFCVATTGSDSAGHGTFANGCFATIPYAEGQMSAGDISYVRNGVVANSDDGFGSPWLIDSSGTAGNPKAMIVYPGETATIGGNATSRGVINYPSGTNYWTIAGLTLQNTGVASGSTSEALHLYQSSSTWRIIGNTFTCPQGDGFTGCVTTDGAPNVWFLGNTIYNTGASTADKTYHAFYFGDHGTTGNANIEVGWNQVYNIQGCRGIMFHSIDSTPGAEGYSLTIHDNLVHDTQCDGIALANVNPDKGAILVYNNVLYAVGKGPDPAGQGANYSCVYTGDTNGSPTTPVLIYNNTCYDAGSRGAAQGDAGAFTTFIPAQYTNNIIYELSGEAYFTASTLSQCSSCISGSYNIWYGITGTPSQTTNNLTTNPSFVSTVTPDFHLSSSGSPANGSGTASLFPVRDFDGLVRPSPPSRGAYEFAAASNVGGSASTGKIVISGKASVH